VEREALNVSLKAIHIHGFRLGVRKCQFFAAGEEASLVGFLHDLGKYGTLFQKRLTSEESGIDHWSAKAWAALTIFKQTGIAAALTIQGHHIGLQTASVDALKSLNPDNLQKRHPLTHS
jgi:CRISPR-associated endonuclease/helicase Cas3